MPPIMKTHTWTKTDKGYSTTEPKWGANIELLTVRTMSDAELDRFLTRFYAMPNNELKSGANYVLAVMGPEA